MPEFLRGLIGAFSLGSRFSAGSLLRATRMLGVSVAVVAAVVSVTASVTSALAYQQKVETTDARTEMFAGSEESSPQPNFRVAYRGDHLSDNLSFPMMVVQQLKPATAPPLGLERWPAPGEVFLSPALVRDGEAEGVLTRYGKFSGVISEEGLSAPDERFAYIGYSPGLVPESSLVPALRFGTTYPHDWWGMSLPWNSETAYIFQFPIFFGALFALVLLPSFSLLLAARRFDADSRATRNRLLKSLGAGRSHRLAAAVGEHRYALGSALLFVTVLDVFVLTRRVVLPVVDYELPRSAITMHLGLLLAIQVVTFASVVLILLEVSNGWRGKAAAGRQPRAVLPWWARVRGVGMFAFFCLASVWLPYLFDPTVGRIWQTTFMALSIATIAALPSALREFLPALGRMVSRFGKAWNRFSLFLAGRLLSVNSRSLAPVATLMVVSTGVLFQVLFMLNSFSAQAQSAVRIADAAAGHLVVADFDKGAGNLEEILMDLPAGVDTAILEVDMQGSSILLGKKDALISLGAGCGEVPQVETDSLLGFATSDVWIEELGPTNCLEKLSSGDGGSFQRLIMFSETELPHDEVRGAVLRHSLPNTPISSPMYGFVSSGLANAHQGQWLVLEGLVGSCLLLFVLVLGLVDRARDQASRLSQVLAVGGSGDLRITVSVITVGLPIIVAGLSGSLLSWLLTRLPISIGLAPDFGTDLAVSMAAVVIIAGGAASYMASSLAESAAREWRP